MQKLNKHESKYFNTACLMDEALLILLETKEFEFITVKEICTKAGVNRSTFYLHYETMNDLLSEALAYITKKFDEKLQGSVGNNKTEPLNDLMLITPKYIIPYLEFLKEYRKVYMAAMKSKIFQADTFSEQALAGTIVPILNKLNVPKEEQKYVTAFYIGGMHELVFTWVKDGCKEPINYICELMMKFVPNK